jgi:hypothetical protein
MSVSTEEKKSYRVTLDQKGMRRIELGPGPLGTRVRCLVPLAGDVDEHWRQSFRSVQLEDTGFFRFRLEMSSKTIAFAATEREDDQGITAELRVLAGLLDSVNTLASKTS